MLIPCTTNASLRHFPWVTIRLIAVNTLVFFATGIGDAPALIRYGVEYGTGAHPLQWITSLFIHVNLGHLVENMLFLWIFGMIVEGHLGWRRFLAVYFGLGISLAAIEQTMLFWFDHGRAFGASSVIFSLAGMCLVWAPETEIECHWLTGSYWFRSMHWVEIQITVLWMAIIYTGLNAYAAWRLGFRPNFATAHLASAAIGFGAGVVALKRRWVDCDGWDLFSTLSGSYLKRNAARRVTSLGSDSLNSSSAEAASSANAAAFVEQQKSGEQQAMPRKGGSALSDYENAITTSPAGQLAESELIHHTDRLCTDGFQNEAVPLLEEYLSRFEKRADVVRLKLAEILIKSQQRPQYGLRVLAAFPNEPLKPRYEKLRQALSHKAQAMIDDGVLELSGRAWRANSP